MEIWKTVNGYEGQVEKEKPLVVLNGLMQKLR